MRAPGTYTVVLTNPAEACPVTREFVVYEVIDICGAILHVPNAFSPNGDGVNDFFTVFGQAVLDYEIRVFNRWGELVYLSDDAGEVGNTADGWDGRYRGEPQPLGTYVYTITATGGDGVTVQRTGQVTLVR